MADVFSSKTGAAGAPSRPLPQAEAIVFTENTSPLMRSLKKAGVGLAQGCARNAQCIVYGVQCTVYSVWCMVYGV